MLQHLCCLLASSVHLGEGSFSISFIIMKLKETIRFPISLLFSRLNKPVSPLVHHVLNFLNIVGPPLDSSNSFSYCWAPNWTQHPLCGHTCAEGRRIISPIELHTAFTNTAQHVVIIPCSKSAPYLKYTT